MTLVAYLMESKMSVQARLGIFSAAMLLTLAPSRAQQTPTPDSLPAAEKPAMPALDVLTPPSSAPAADAPPSPAPPEAGALSPPPQAQAVYPPCSRTLQDQCTNTKRESDTKAGASTRKRRR